MGGRGDDTLTGGDGADRFVFGINADNDTITDFEGGTDTIVIKSGRSFSDLTIGKNANGDAVITGYSSGTGASVTLEVGGGTVTLEGASITLEGVTASELTESDFEFLG